MDIWNLVLIFRVAVRIDTRTEGRLIGVTPSGTQEYELMTCLNSSVNTRFDSPLQDWMWLICFVIYFCLWLYNS